MVPAAEKAVQLALVQIRGQSHSIAGAPRRGIRHFYQHLRVHAALWLIGGEQAGCALKASRGRGADKHRPVNVEQEDTGGQSEVQDRARTHMEAKLFSSMTLGFHDGISM